MNYTKGAFKIHVSSRAVDNGAKNYIVKEVEKFNVLYSTSPISWISQNSVDEVYSSGPAPYMNMYLFSRIRLTASANESLWLVRLKTLCIKGLWYVR